MLQMKPPDPGFRRDDGKDIACRDGCAGQMLRVFVQKFQKCVMPPKGGLNFDGSGGMVFAEMTILAPHYPLTLTTYTNFESVANRIFADFYKKFFASVAKIPKKAKIKSAGFLQFFEKNWPPQKKLKINPKKHLTFFNYRFILCGLSKLGRVQKREILTSGTRKFRNIVNKSSSSK